MPTPAICSKRIKIKAERTHPPAERHPRRHPRFLDQQRGHGGHPADTSCTRLGTHILCTNLPFVLVPMLAVHTWLLTCHSTTNESRSSPLSTQFTLHPNPSQLSSSPPPQPTPAMQFRRPYKTSLPSLPPLSSPRAPPPLTTPSLPHRFPP